MLLKNASLLNDISDVHNLFTDEDKIEWVIVHPDSSGKVVKCHSFEEAMDKWFEGMNCPRKFINREGEDFSISIERVRQYLEKDRSEIKS